MFAFKRSFKFSALALSLSAASLFPVSAFANNPERIPLGSEYREYKHVVDNHSNLVWTRGTQHQAPQWTNVLVDGNIYSDYFRNDATQKWLFMPLYPGSQDYYIVNKSDGGVADIVLHPFQYGVGNIYSHQNYPYGGVNQIFQLEYVPHVTHNSFKFYSRDLVNNSAIEMNGLPIGQPGWHPFNDPRIGRNIYFAPVNNSLQQTFRLDNGGPIYVGFTDYLPLQASTTPDVPKELSHFGAGVDDYTSVKTVAESIVPFVFVRDDLPRHVQVTTSPYYKITRKVAYKVAASQVYPRGIAGEKVLTYSVGTTTGQSREMERSLDVTFTASGEVSYLRGSFGAKAAFSYSHSLGIRTKEVEKFEHTEIKTESTKFYLTGEYQTRLVVYQKVDLFELSRIDGTVIKEWEVVSDNNDFIQHIACLKAHDSDRCV